MYIFSLYDFLFCQQVYQFFLVCASFYFFLIRAAFCSTCVTQKTGFAGFAKRSSSSSLCSCGRRLRRPSNPCRIVAQEVRLTSNIDSFAKTVCQIKSRTIFFDHNPLPRCVHGRTLTTAVDSFAKTVHFKKTRKFS